MFGVPGGFVTIDFCVTCTEDYALKSQVLVGLPGNYTLYSIQRQSEQIMHSHRTARPSKDKKEKQKRITSRSEDRTGSRCIHQCADFLFCRMWAVFPDGLTAAHLEQWLIALLHIVSTEIFAQQRSALIFTLGDSTKLGIRAESY